MRQIVLLYLLYSDTGEKETGSGMRSCHFSRRAERVPGKLMEPEEQFADTGEVRRLFEKNFGRN